ncbi:MAG TPA: hypothetical protein VLA84_19490 [Microcoleus sp.]|nr:hypothetical protein [Microcoleus sp.]
MHGRSSSEFFWLIGAIERSAFPSGFTAHYGSRCGRSFFYRYLLEF